MDENWTTRSNVQCGGLFCELQQATANKCKGRGRYSKTETSSASFLH